MKRNPPWAQQTGVTFPKSRAERERPGPICPRAARVRRRKQRHEITTHLNGRENQSPGRPHQPRIPLKNRFPTWDLTAQRRHFICC